MSELPKGWVEALVTELVEIHDARRIPLNSNQRKNMKGPFPYYGANGIVDRINDYLFDGNYVLLAEDGGYFEDKFRPVAYEAQGKFWVNNHAHILKPLDEIKPSYICKILNSIDWLPLVGGSTRLKLTQAGLGRTWIAIAPLPEQRRIVAKIDSLTARTKRARDSLGHIPRLVEKYKQVLLTAAFRGELTREWREENGIQSDYEFLKLTNFLTVVTGSTPSTNRKDEYFGGEIAFVKPTDLDAGYHVNAARETLTEVGAAVARRVPAGSTLVTCIGATISKTGFARVACCTNQQINALVPRPGVVIPEWVYWMVVSPEFKQEILDNSSATTLPIINKGRFQELKLPRVSLQEQHEIVHRIESAFAWIDRLAAEAASARALVDRLDQAVLAKAFRGELVPQDPADEPASVLLERIRAEREAAPRPKARRGRPPKSAR